MQAESAPEVTPFSGAVLICCTVGRQANGSMEQGD